MKFHQQPPLPHVGVLEETLNNDFCIIDSSPPRWLNVLRMLTLLHVRMKRLEYRHVTLVDSFLCLYVWMSYWFSDITIPILILLFTYFFPLIVLFFKKLLKLQNKANPKKKDNEKKEKWKMFLFLLFLFLFFIFIFSNSVD